MTFVLILYHLTVTKAGGVWVLWIFLLFFFIIFFFFLNHRLYYLSCLLSFKICWKERLVALKNFFNGFNKILIVLLTRRCLQLIRFCISLRHYCSLLILSLWIVLFNIKRLIITWWLIHLPLVITRRLIQFPIHLRLFIRRVKLLVRIIHSLI